MKGQREGGNEGGWNQGSKEEMKAGSCGRRKELNTGMVFMQLKLKFDQESP